MYKILFFPFLFVFISCITTTEPKVYDKSIAIIDKESQLIQILINNNDYENAEIQIEKNLKLYPGKIELLELKAWLLLRQNNLEKSEKLFLSLLEKNKNNPHAYAGLARIYRLTNKKDKAMEYINKGISLLPILSILWLEKGILEYENNDLKKALTNFNKAYTLDNKNIEAYFFKYLTLLKQGTEFDEIKQYWEKITEKKLTKSWFFLYHADALYNLKYYDAAFDVVKNGINNYPDDPYLLNMYSFFLYKKYLKEKDKNTLIEAEKTIKKCFENTKKLEPGFIDTYFCILEANENIEKLKKEINKYLIIFPYSEIIIKWMKKIY